MQKRNSSKKGDNKMQYYYVIGGFVFVCVAVILYSLLNPKQSFILKPVIDHDEFLVHNSLNHQFTQGANTQFEN